MSLEITIGPIEEKHHLQSARVFVDGKGTCYFLQKNVSNYVWHLYDCSEYSEHRQFRNVESVTGAVAFDILIPRIRRFLIQIRYKT